jgi:hypothetical protein
LGFLIQNETRAAGRRDGSGKTCRPWLFGAAAGVPAFVVTTAHLTRKWIRETHALFAHWRREPVSHEIHGLTPYPLPPADVYIVHYLLLRKWKNALPQYGFACAVFDEI